MHKHKVVRISLENASDIPLDLQITNLCEVYSAAGWSLISALCVTTEILLIFSKPEVAVTVVPMSAHGGTGGPLPVQPTITS